jgi:hypothetical protein
MENDPNENTERQLKALLSKLFEWIEKYWLRGYAENEK